MTNGWIDIKNTDLMLVMGGNPAENHPCGFKWVIEAKRQRNAKLIVVDPRFTRTAAVADMFVQIRTGSDIAVLGGIINYALQNDRVNHEYLVNFTNAAFIVKDGFKLPEDGLYSGYDASKRTYDKATWNYQEGGNLTGKVVPIPAAGHAGAPSGNGSNGNGAGAQNPSSKGEVSAGHGLQGFGPAGAKGVSGPAPTPQMPPNVAYDLSLQHPRCVYQLLKQQYSRYTPEMLDRIA